MTLNDGIACYINVAPCSIDLKAYSGYDGGSCTSAIAGYIRLNGRTVWSASFCGSTNLRGVNILLINLHSCTVQQIRNYDTHDRSRDAATDLKDYLESLTPGSVVVGVSADEARWHLGNALPALQQLGVYVSDVWYRGSFGFIAQKGFPRKTVLCKVLTERDSNVRPAQCGATIRGWLNTVL